MASVRLKVNMVIDGKNHPFDSVIDDQLIPPHLRSPLHVDYGVDRDDGRVMILREANFNSVRIEDGVRISFPVMRAAGELISREEIPDGWVEGQDYKSSWSPEERRSVQEREHAAYLAQFQNEPEPAVQAPWRSR